jgi:hypothetical protein
MKIRKDGKEILNDPNCIIEIVLGDKDTLQMTTPAADYLTCVYVTSYDNSKLSFEGGESIIEKGSITATKSTFEIRKDNGLFILNGDKLAQTEMYDLSVSMVPRIIRQLLDNSKIDYNYSNSSAVETFSVDISSQELFEQMVRECIEYRCSLSAASGYSQILRQLPIRVAIEESDKLIAIGKKHAIYTSAHGGYNIKVKGYINGKLEHYSHTESRMWD